MEKLETLILSGCYRLCKFPEIQTSMDNLVELCLNGTGIVIAPSSIGHYCTNLLYLDLRHCRYLQSIEGNFRLLKHLKVLHLNDCDQLNNISTEGLFDVECCLQLLSSFKNLHRCMVSMKLFGVSSSLRMLNLRDCNLVDGDVSSVFCEELSNLEALECIPVSCNFHVSNSSICHIAIKLVELPDLPSSISILIAKGCDSLDVIGDFPTNVKWLWKVSLSGSKIVTVRGYCNPCFREMPLKITLLVSDLMALTFQ